MNAPTSNLEQLYATAARAFGGMETAARKAALAEETADTRAILKRAEDAAVEALDAICRTSPLERREVLRELLSNMTGDNLLAFAELFREAAALQPELERHHEAHAERVSWRSR